MLPIAPQQYATNRRGSGVGKEDKKHLRAKKKEEEK
jgi:hypothetical protein